MKNNKKGYLIIFCLLVVGVLTALFFIYIFPHLIKKTVPSKPVNVFGAPRTKEQHDFPSDKPEFTAIIGTIKPASVHQQTIIVYRIGDAKKTPLFARNFYDDGFRGSELIYDFSAKTASFSQSGSLGTIGCNTDDCLLPWSNFYTWDDKQHAFILDNASHKEEFQKLLDHYQEIDKKGCNIIGGDIVKNQNSLSFSALYTKYAGLSWYCSKTNGILPSSLTLFLQTEQAAQRVVAEENIGSEDIRSIEL